MPDTTTTGTIPKFTGGSSGFDQIVATINAGAADTGEVVRFDQSTKIPYTRFGPGPTTGIPSFLGASGLATAPSFGSQMSMSELFRQLHSMDPAARRAMLKKVWDAGFYNERYLGFERTVEGTVTPDFDDVDSPVTVQAITEWFQQVWDLNNAGADLSATEYLDMRAVKGREALARAEEANRKAKAEARRQEWLQAYPLRQMDPEDATMAVEELFQGMLGRGATDEEKAQVVGWVNQRWQQAHAKAAEAAVTAPDYASLGEVAGGSILKSGEAVRYRTMQAYESLTDLING